MEQTDWVSLHPCHRALMRWTAALISKQATDRRKQAFIQQLRRALSSTTRLSALEAADVLAEFIMEEDVETKAFRAEVIEQLEGLTQLGSCRLSDWARRKMERLRSRCAERDGDPMPEDLTRSLMPAAQWQTPTHDLAEVLRQLGQSVPSGTEERLLEDRRVLRSLIDGLCQTTSPNLKRDCAVWLDRAPLSKVLEVHVPEQRWWKSRTRSALEILAHCATEPESDERTRRWLYSILAREDRVLQLWQRGDEFLPLVYELLLALDQRLFLMTGLLTKPEWHIMS